ncbi:hypothetical protein DIC78_10200 [Bacillus halotolerans]|nr:hypothetical protein DIC78_10200 [Bacillus halotolerans]MDQ7726178.1 hypothetical protein [Bacillus halotolerans]QDK69764.1 hypothetical protein FLQ13_07905 [Bacillus halotolerans]
MRLFSERDRTQEFL